METEKISKQNMGNAGEFYIAYLLSSMNYVVMITLGRNEGYDLVALNPSGKSYRISVKTRKPKTKKSFPLRDKDGIFKGNDFYYAFVRLNNFEDEPDYWIVPSRVVSEVVKNSHESYLKEPNKEGGKHQDSKIRTFWVANSRYYPENWGEEIKKYYKNWDLLNLPEN